ncbi:hypothetical protein MESS2_310079 [Mesorhizobium metallidurans STM 2683]|uniref:Uncharacterized protein n=1 Tax=Mesorhizobium metallidurans STM 2683 TaxID=1297569 RepID=M5ENY7_9HYPH|nr:hypothetical protein MESS2_310079 [Mesorhizobium metallidurans STM 2683]
MRRSSRATIAPCCRRRCSTFWNASACSIRCADPVAQKHVLGLDPWVRSGFCDNDMHKSCRMKPFKRAAL